MQGALPQISNASQKKKFVCTTRTFLILGVPVFFFGTGVRSGDLLPRRKLPNIDSFKERTKEWVLN